MLLIQSAKSTPEAFKTAKHKETKQELAKTPSSADKSQKRADQLLSNAERSKVATKEVLALVEEYEKCKKEINWERIESYIRRSSAHGSPVKGSNQSSPKPPKDSETPYESEAEIPSLSTIQLALSKHWADLHELKTKFEIEVCKIESDCEMISKKSSLAISRLRELYHKRFRNLEEVIESEKRSGQIQLQIYEVERNSELQQLEIELSSLESRAETYQKAIDQQSVFQITKLQEVPNFDFSLGVSVIAVLLGILVYICFSKVLASL